MDEGETSVSYDVHFSAVVDGHEVCVFEAGNHTSNCSPMWAKALRSAGCEVWPSELNGKRAGEYAKRLEQAVAHMAQHPDEYRPMNPTNGWGSYETALEYLSKIADGAREFPSSTIRVSA